MTQRVSVGLGGAEPDGPSYSAWISDDGRYVAFASDASNLVASDTNAWTDVFVRDRQLGMTERVSVDSAGAEALGASNEDHISISADGRFVAFASHAPNLVPADWNASMDVFVRDRQLGTTELASVDSAGVQGNDESGYNGLSISADGRYVAFWSESYLVPGDTNFFGDIFVRDRLLGTTERVSVSSTGTQANGSAHQPAISADGRFVSFTSGATNLVPGDTNLNADVFVRDRWLGSTERVSVTSTGAQASQYSSGYAISGDGRYVPFTSLASNVVPGDTNGVTDVFVRDRQLATTARVSVDALGGQANHFSNGATISADGRFVAFGSRASNLVPGDTNAAYDVFVRDLALAATTRVGTDSAGAQANGYNERATQSAGGRYVAFRSGATNLVAGDNNGHADIFVRDRGGLFPGTFCTAGTTSSGCVASIGAAGNPSASAGSGFFLSASAVEGQKQGLFFYGLDNAGFSALPWGPGSSWLCVKAPTQRTPAQNSGGTLASCTGTFALDWNAFIAANPAALGNPFMAGRHVFVQAWFRDPPAAKTTNLSDALEFVVDP